MKRISNESKEKVAKKSKLSSGNNILQTDSDFDKISKLRKEEKNANDLKPRFPPPLTGVKNAPVFYPTETEFKDPFTYLENIYAEAEKFGICKIVPPSNWRPPFSIDPDKLKFYPRIQPLYLLEAKRRLWDIFHNKLRQFWSMYLLKIKHPVKIGDIEVDLSDLNYARMEISMSAGSPKKISTDGWKRVATKLKFDLKLANDLRDLYDTLILPMDKFTESIHAKVNKHNQAQEKLLKSSPRRRRTMAGSWKRKSPKKPMTIRGDEGGFNFYQLSTAFVVNNVCTACETCPGRDIIECMVCEANFHTSCLKSYQFTTSFLCSNPSTFTCLGCGSYQAFNDPLLTFGFEDSVRKYSLSDFADYADIYKKVYFGVDNPAEVPERKTENEFWRLVLGYDEYQTVLYGTDLHSNDVGSGFPVKKLNTKKGKVVMHEQNDDLVEYKESEWNLNNLPISNSSVLRHIGDDVSGMTQPWLYFGMVFSAFCWHVEDHFTPSINYLHFGETKTWYGIPGSQAVDVDKRIKEYVPSLFVLTPNVLHNLNTMIHPNEFTNVGIHVSRIDQHAGEFVITFPRAYHGGFNQGFNCAEAVNFATPKWIPFGFDSIDHYMSIKRNHVFSHEELLFKMASDPSLLRLEEAKEIYVQLSIFIAEQSSLVKELDELGVKSRERVLLEKIKDDNCRTCFSCSRTMFFSMISCRCRSNQALNMNQSCPSHFRQLCRCALAKRQFKYRYTLDELVDFDTKLYSRIVELVGENTLPAIDPTSNRAAQVQ